MDKFDKHLQFLLKALPFSETVVSTVFLEQAKRDVRKALFFLYQPKETVPDLLSMLATNKTSEHQLTLLHKIFHCYCPNASYTAVVKDLSKGKPFKIDTVSTQKLKVFRRAPRKEVLYALFDACADADKEVLIALLKGMRPFGRELQVLWSRIDAYANYPDVEIVKVALVLLSKMPGGVQKSIMTFARYAIHPELSMTALSSMQEVYDLSGQLLLQLFGPLIDAYRQLIPAQGAMNDWWQEFRLLQQVLRNNGVVLNLPDIQLGRF